MTIAKLPKGCHPDPKDDRDFDAEPILGAQPPVDWNTPFKLPDPGDYDQGSSFSCVSHAWSYSHTQLPPKAYSRRDLYPRIYLPQSGASTRTGGLAIVNN